MKSLVYWLRYASFLYPNKLITGANFDWLTDNKTIKHTVVYLWRGLIFTIGGISIIIAVIANKFFLLRIKSFFQRKTTVKSHQKHGCYFYILCCYSSFNLNRIITYPINLLAPNIGVSFCIISYIVIFLP